MTSGIEIERKYLVQAEAAEILRGHVPTHMRQGFLWVRGSRVVRVRIMADQATLALKDATPRLSRSEDEHPLDIGLAETLFDACQPFTVTKRRYSLIHSGWGWEVDVFDDLNTGLVLAEVELGSEKDRPDVPPWCGEEVTGDERFYNEYLARRPFTRWGS